MPGNAQLKYTYFEPLSKAVHVRPWVIPDIHFHEIITFQSHHERSELISTQQVGMQASLISVDLRNVSSPGLQQSDGKYVV